MVKILFVEKILTNRILIQGKIPDFCTVVSVPDFTEASSILEEATVDIILTGPSVSAEECRKISRYSFKLVIFYKKAETNRADYKIPEKDACFLELASDPCGLNEIIEQYAADRLKTYSAVERYRLNSRMSALVGSSDKMIRVKEEILGLCNAPGPVLVTGESGTGKEIIARLLHDFSDRKYNTFHAVNAGAIPAALSVSEFFGSSQGAYTGAVNRAGHFEFADGGTLFLDEIADIEPSAQAELLRVLESGEVRKLGSNRIKRIDARLISATNKNLPKETLAGRFRQDLLFRIDEFRIQLPPLRERMDDIPELLMHFSSQLSSERPNKQYEMTDSFIERLYEHNWPGNVRELRNVFRRAVYSSPSGFLTADSIRYGF